MIGFVNGIGPTATSNLRFRQCHRLLTAADYDGVFAQAKRTSDKFYTVLYVGTFAQSSRIGFAIAKKRVSRAPGRNRLKRIARESFRHNRHSLASEQNAYDIVVLANSAAATASNEQLFASLDTHWQRIRGTADPVREHHQ
ncbi:MAG: ribonuclease P protein component [Chromatiales bacterium]|nr:ribonuclease P protein component [Chromatiales bacterium]